MKFKGGDRVAKREDKNINLESLRLENIEWQFCSDYLKDEIRKIILKRDCALAALKTAREALYHYSKIADSDGALSRDRREIAREALEKIEEIEKK